MAAASAANVNVSQSLPQQNTTSSQHIPQTNQSTGAIPKQNAGATQPNTDPGATGSTYPNLNEGMPSSQSNETEFCKF